MTTLRTVDINAALEDSESSFSCDVFDEIKRRLVLYNMKWIGSELAFADNNRMREALELPLLFHSGGKPNAERWQEITGTREMTTKVMCDYIRASVAGWCK